MHDETEFNILTDAIGEIDANHVIDGTRVARRESPKLVEGEATSAPLT